MTNKNFSALKSLNNTQFELQQKNKDYDRYVDRIEQIIHKKHVFDESPHRYMKILKTHKSIATKHQRENEAERISSENQCLFQKIVALKKRKNQSMPENYDLKLYLKRKRELEKINQENEALAARLAERYSGHCSTIPPASKHQLKKSHSLEPNAFSKSKENGQGTSQNQKNRIKQQGSRSQFQKSANRTNLILQHKKLPPLLNPSAIEQPCPQSALKE